MNESRMIEKNDNPLLNKVIPKLFWEHDFNYLYDIFNYFCKGEPLKELSRICPEECRKNTMEVLNSPGGVWGVIGMYSAYVRTACEAPFQMERGFTRFSE